MVNLFTKKNPRPNRTRIALLNHLFVVYSTLGFIHAPYNGGHRLSLLSLGFFSPVLSITHLSACNSRVIFHHRYWYRFSTITDSLERSLSLTVSFIVFVLYYNSFGFLHVSTQVIVCSQKMSHIQYDSTNPIKSQTTCFFCFKIYQKFFQDRATVLIIDDSMFESNRSKKVELFAKPYDHANHRYHFGLFSLMLLPILSHQYRFLKYFLNDLNPILSKSN